MHKIIERPLFIFIGYILIICVFAIFYSYSPEKAFGKDLNGLESIYLSVITITTLGYGDITPKNDFGMIATSLESILGILIIGLFINSSWKNFSEKIDKQQSEKIKSSLKESNKSNLLSYYSFLSTVINDYKRAAFELTTPMGERNEKDGFKYDFKFSDLQDLLNPSLLLKYGFDNTVIEIYYETEEALIRELKYLLANFGLEEFTSIKSHILLFLNVAQTTGVKSALLTYVKFSQENNTRKMLIDLIKKFEDLPPKEYHQSNMITPVIVLYQSIPIKMQFIEKIEKDFKELSSET